MIPTTTTLTRVRVRAKVVVARVLQFYFVTKTRRIRGRTTPRGIRSFIHSLIRERVRVGSGVIGRGQNLIESVYATDANDANGDVWDDFGGGIVVVVVGETVEGWCGVDVGGGARTRDDVDETYQGRRVDRFRVVVGLF